MNKLLLFDMRDIKGRKCAQFIYVMKIDDSLNFSYSREVATTASVVSLIFRCGSLRLLFHFVLILPSNSINSTCFSQALHGILNNNNDIQTSPLVNQFIAVTITYSLHQKKPIHMLEVNIEYA